MNNWSEPFIPTKTGQGPEGVSNETHEIEARLADHCPWSFCELPMWFTTCQYRYRVRTGTTTPSGADGSAYYDLTIKGVTISCNDVIDALGLNFNSGNEFKAIWRDGRKTGVDRRYDLEKRVYFATRELENHKDD